jgi:hypothetical protein
MAISVRIITRCDYTCFVAAKGYSRWIIGTLGICTAHLEYILMYIMRHTMSHRSHSHTHVSRDSYSYRSASRHVRAAPVCSDACSLSVHIAVRVHMHQHHS